MAQPQWITDSGSLGTIAEGIFFNTPVVAVDPDGGVVKYVLIAGSLPEGIQVRTNGTIDGVPTPYSNVQGVPAEVGEDVVSNFAIRAYVEENGITRINDRTFSITVTGQDIPEFVTPAGRIGTFYDGNQVNINLEFTDQDPGDSVTVSLYSGELPPGLSISSDGKITGYIEPVVSLSDTAIAGYDNNTFDEFAFDFSQRSFNKNYQFTIKISDGKDQNIRTFEIYVYSNDALTSDTLQITGDDTFVTADAVPGRPPIITTLEGSIGKYRSDNFFEFKFDAVKFSEDTIEIIKTAGTLPSGLILEPKTGYLYGFLPDLGATDLTFSFSLQAQNVFVPAIAWSASESYVLDDIVSYQGSNYQALQDLGAGIFPTNDLYWYKLDTLKSKEYDYTINVIGNIESSVTWLTGSLIPDRPVSNPIYSLGTIDSGAVSLLGIQATTPGDRLLQFRLKPGRYPETPGVYNKLPQGLNLLPSGEIAGRATFNTFALDSGTTTFDGARATRLDNNPTTFDQQFDFTVEAYSSDGLISVFRTFRIFLNRAYNSPYESLYIQALPPQEDRDLLDGILQNTDVIPPDVLFRKTDPYFGVASDVKYVHAFSLDSATTEEYVESLQFNHFRKNILLGPLKTAQALDENDNVIYEVIYSEIVDTGLNVTGDSPGQTVDTAFPILGQDGSTETTKVYPNSLVNMRDQVIDTVGQTNVVLPLWMTSKQRNGKVLGFTRAWVIAYTQPGESERLAYNINDQFANTLNTIDIEVDRYVLDRSMTKNWVPNEDSTDGGNWLTAKQTTFDFNESTGPDITNLDNPTTFDGGSLRFNRPVDTYEFTNEYDKYLLYPKYNILGGKEDDQHSTRDSITNGGVAIN